MTSRGQSEKPPGAWTPDQVVDMLLAGMSQGDFYILCPDNDVTRDIDNRRITWAAQDITENRLALSRWHPDYKSAFDRFLHEKLPIRSVSLPCLPTRPVLRLCYALRRCRA